MTGCACRRIIRATRCGGCGRRTKRTRDFTKDFQTKGSGRLCHIAHTRPVFRPEDWLHYQRINRRFADVVLQEMEGTESPILLAQDYHFALLPRMVKEARPDARVAIFWHIPWPNPEVFGICPWQRELVDGLLGADLIGFHIQTHCNNFLETVDHALEALTEWDRFAVNRQGHVTRVRPYPISVAFPETLPNEEEMRNAGAERALICEELGIEASLLGVGVDRVDYTKGILERFRAIERFLEQYPSYQRRFSLIQIGAPSRTDIERYKNFLDEVTAEAERINAKFHAGRWKPIVFLKRHHSHEEITRYYRAASVCLVTSLHDGMNLVAKEFVASRADDRGVLILSTFAGAALRAFRRVARESVRHHAVERGDPLGARNAGNGAGQANAMDAARGEGTQHLPVGGKPAQRSDGDPNRSDRPSGGAADAMTRTRRTTPHLFAQWDRIARRIRREKRVVMFLDFDGTLVRIAPVPSGVRLENETRDILQKLARHRNLTLAVISGRQRAELQRYIGIRNLKYMGLYGWESKGNQRVPFPIRLALVRTLVSLLPELPSYPGVWIEPKRSSFSVHLLGASAETQRQVRQQVKKRVKPVRETLRSDVKPSRRRGCAHCRLATKVWQCGKCSTSLPCAGRCRFISATIFPTSRHLPRRGREFQFWWANGGRRGPSSPCADRRKWRRRCPGWKKLSGEHRTIAKILRGRASTR